ncbi:hypothetical protein MNR01_02830 [Lysobacter sp. S4-A87]|uniref:hypothetical protein n=1 Tax=Lysobacter sp. S4-A87 TaxID=2925843 RepID=UPI001F53AB45|nr:hypothetical protein [Lysobacter sp. S4-A87]UNK49993.1 hypothetical protein MNR01_02830 [Lysobacter sp. S4-A87]
MAPSAATVCSRQVLWIDDECVRLQSTTGQAPAQVALSRTGDVAAALVAVETLLGSALPRPRRRGLHRVEVVVSGAFACYFILPWAPWPRPADWLASARTKFVLDGLGAPESWRFSVEDAPWGRARMAAAAPEALCARIARLCKAQALRLGRIEPAFTRALSRHAAQVEDGSIAIVEIEERAGRRSIAHVGFRNEKQWTGYIALPAVAPIEHVVRDAAFLCGAASLQRTYLIAPACMQALMSGLPGGCWLPSHAGSAP